MNGEDNVPTECLVDWKKIIPVSDPISEGGGDVDTNNTIITNEEEPSLIVLHQKSKKKSNKKSNHDTGALNTFTTFQKSLPYCSQFPTN